MKKLFTLCFTVLLITACSDTDNTPDTGIEEENSNSEVIKDVVEQLNNTEGFSTFTKVLKKKDFGDYKGALTILAVHDEAVGIETVDTDQLSMYIIKGAYNEVALSSIKSLKTINGEELAVETDTVSVEEQEKKMTYLGGNLLYGTSKKIGQHIVYTMYKSFSNRPTPPVTNKEAYKNWLGEKLNGTWVVSKNDLEKHYHYHESGAVANSIPLNRLKSYESYVETYPLKEHVGSCYITFGYSDEATDYSYGDVKVNHGVYHNSTPCPPEATMYALATMPSDAVNWSLSEYNNEGNISHSIILRYKYPIMSTTSLSIDAITGFNSTIRLENQTSFSIGGMISEWLVNDMSLITYKKISDKPLFTPEEIREHLRFLH